MVDNDPRDPPTANGAPQDGAAPSDGAATEEAAPAAAAELPQDPEALRARIAQLAAQLEQSFALAREGQTKLKDEHERLLRLAAEFENYKRRAAKEKDDTRKYGSESLLKDFLPVADNLERALDHAEQHDPKAVIEGVRLVQKMLEAGLAKHGVVGFSAVGQMFDPAQHEALMHSESDAPPNTVVQEMARGYKLHDRLVRPAAVVVAKPRAQPAPAEGAADAHEP